MKKRLRRCGNCRNLVRKLVFKCISRDLIVDVNDTCRSRWCWDQIKIRKYYYEDELLNEQDREGGK